MPSEPHLLDLRAVRRLALARAGLLASKWTGLPSTARGVAPSARAAAHSVIDRFGYLQLDTISVAGARSHTLILLSRLEGMRADLGEQLLVPDAPLCEVWGHEACWIPADLYPAFEFRRAANRTNPRWGPRVDGNGPAADALLSRAREEGPFRSTDLDGKSSGGWWKTGKGKRLAEALWHSGELAIRERRNFRRVYDLPERVIPADVLAQRISTHDAFRTLILRALDGHGWAEERTIAATWRLRRTSAEFAAALQSLADEGAVLPCTLQDGNERLPGWIRPRDLELAGRLRRIRPRLDRGMLLTPFDPLLWDRARARLLFGFDVVLEIYVPAAKRRFGYFCMPVLAGEQLVARVDVKADRRAGRLRLPAVHIEQRHDTSATREAVRTAVNRHARAVGLDVDSDWHPSWS